MECVSDDSRANTCDCITFPSISKVECKERPTELMLLYNGGDCSQGGDDGNVDRSRFDCVDYYGGPTSRPGVESYIVVTDAKSGEEIFFEGFVNVGSYFVLLPDDGDYRFPPSLVAKIYHPGGYRDKLSIISSGVLLQKVEFDTSCAQSKFMRFLLF